MVSQVPPRVSSARLAIIRHALVRSRVKLRILFALLDLHTATFADLAREARAGHERIEGAIFGDGDAYRVSTSLKRIGLVRVQEGIVARTVVLTPLGSTVARAWRSESTRATIGLRRHPHG